MQWADSCHTHTTTVTEMYTKSTKMQWADRIVHKINCTENNKNAVGGFLPHSYNYCVTEMYTKLIAYTKKQLSGRIPDTLGKTVHQSDAAQADEIHSYTHSLQICTMRRLQSVFNRCSSWVVSSTDCIKYTSYQRHRDGWVQRSRLHKDGWVQRSRLHKLLSIDIIRGQ